MAKRKQSKLVRGILSAAGILFICAAIYFFINGIHTYIQQLGQRDWKVTSATVINVDERRKSSGGRHSRRHTHIVYDIVYQYEAGGNIYTGTITGSNAASNYGDAFDIKYDTESPKDSTPYLEPSGGVIVGGIFGLILFGFIGSCMLRFALPKKKVKSSHKCNKG